MLGICHFARKGERPSIASSGGNMRAIKAVGLGTTFAAVLFVTFVVGLIAQNGVRHTGRALGLGVVKGSTIYNPYFWLVVVLAYGAAFWLTRKG
jgi:hypothetical protein